MCLVWGAFLQRELTCPYIPVYMYIIYISTCTYTYVYIILIHIQTNIHIHIHIHTKVHAYLYILRRNKLMNRMKKRVQSINTYKMSFIGNNRHLYLIILAINNAENYQFTAIDNSLEYAVCIYF